MIQEWDHAAKNTDTLGDESMGCGIYVWTDRFVGNVLIGNSPKPRFKSFASFSPLSSIQSVKWCESVSGAKHTRAEPIHWKTCQL